ncbi:MAG: class I SAM-dependent methyltransferase [Moraxellaceae bacterium]|nr:MAG: class I SAM-dependent methyltransferase [Moraxellaceae bacterium]
MAFLDAQKISGYADNALKMVPGLADLHKMMGILLAERAPTDAHILVLGAGGGMELKTFAEAQADWQFKGIDPSKAMLDLARITLGELNARVHLHEGYIESTPLALFDGASCLLTLHFLKQPERLATLKELYRRLKPGAALVIAHHSFTVDTPEPDQWLKRNAAYAIASGMPVELAQSNIPALKERLPILSPEQDTELLRKAGFVDIEMFYCAFTFKGWIAYRP